MSRFQTGIVKLVASIRRHLSNPDSEYRQIALGFVWVSFFVLIGKLAGAAKEMTIAWRYGVSPTVDAYVFVFNLVNWPISILFSTLTVVLIPLAARLQHDTPDELSRFRSELFGLTLLAGMGLGLLATLGLPCLLRAGWLGLSSQALALMEEAVSSMALLAPMGAMIGLFSAWLMGAGHHRNTLYEAIPALVIVTALLLPPTWIPEPLLWGTVAGFAMHAVALASALTGRQEFVPPRIGFHSPVWSFFWNSLAIMALGQVLMSSTNLIDQFFASSLGTGEVSILSYANRILALVLGLGATAISRATLPVLSAVHAKGANYASTVALRWAQWMFALGMVVLGLGWIAAPWGVELLFQRGAFTAADGARVTEVLRYALIQTPFYFSSLTLVVLLSASRAYSPLMYLGGISLVTKLILVSYLTQELGLAGLVVSNGVIYFINTVILVAYIKYNRAQNNED